jgi:hypothetical protein
MTRDVVSSESRVHVTNKFFAFPQAVLGVCELGLYQRELGKQRLLRLQTQLLRA